MKRKYFKMNVIESFIGILVFLIIGCQYADSSSSADDIPMEALVEIDSSLMKFEMSIKAFEKKDSIQFPPKNAILFVGSSSIRLWTSLAEDLAPYPVINRGFGGSTMAELNYYANRIVVPYEPRIIFLYEGDNDIASDSFGPADLREDVFKFVEEMEQKLPETEILQIDS